MARAKEVAAREAVAAALVVLAEEGVLVDWAAAGAEQVAVVEVEAARVEGEAARAGVVAVAAARARVAPTGSVEVATATAATARVAFGATVDGVVGWAVERVVREAGVARASGGDHAPLETRGPLQTASWRCPPTPN